MNLSPWDAILRGRHGAGRQQRPKKWRYRERDRSTLSSDVLPFESLWMRIIDAMTLRDGGTTCVSLEKGNETVHVTFNYSLPWDGRLRYIVVSTESFGRGESEDLEPHTENETRLIEEIRDAAVDQYGSTVVTEFLRQCPETNPGQGKWFYVFNFLRLASKERGFR